MSSKPRLRTILRDRLAALSDEERSAASQAILDRFLSLPELRRARRVLSCLSFGHEVDTWPLVDRLQVAGIEVLVPRADPRDRQLHLHPYPCELTTLSFGLRQPRRDAPALDSSRIDETVDLAVVLGLGFDLDGYRLGYGSGYFDRFLARRPFPAIALAYEVQILDRMPAEPHDIPMASVVTETRRIDAGDLVD